jgi:hypothetical protein
MYKYVETKLFSYVENQDFLHNRKILSNIDRKSLKQRKITKETGYGKFVTVFFENFNVN